MLEIKFGEQRRRSLQQQDDFYPEGVWGMAFAPLSSVGATPLMDSLISAWGVPDLFSHCLAASGIGGQLMIGDILPYSGSMMWTPLVARSFYSILLKDLQVNGVSLGLPPVVYNTKQTIVDSGTPTVTLPPKAFNGLRALFEATCNTTSPLKGICGVAQGKTLFDGTAVPTAQSLLTSIQASASLSPLPTSPASRPSPSSSRVELHLTTSRLRTSALSSSSATSPTLSPWRSRTTRPVLARCSAWPSYSRT